MFRKQRKNDVKIEGEYTVMSCDKRMRGRFAELFKILECLNLGQTISANDLANMKNNIDDLVIKYSMRTVGYMIACHASNREFQCEYSPRSDQYHSAQCDIEKITRAYFNTIIVYNYDGAIAEICAQLTKIMDIAHMVPTLTIAECLNHAKSWSCVPSSHSADAPLQCCGMPMHIFQELSEAMCNTCGHIEPITGTLFKDEQIFSQDSSKGRRSGYIYMRHLKMWLERLQAIENFVPDEQDLKRLRNVIESDCMGAVDWHSIRYSAIQRYINICKLNSKLGEHIPQVMRLIGARAPQPLEYDTVQIIIHDFVNIMDVYASLYPEPGNKPYYPFFIKKVIMRNFSGSSQNNISQTEAQKARRLLDFIESQECDTARKNDKIFRNICEHAPAEYGLVYVPENI